MLQNKFSQTPSSSRANNSAVYVHDGLRQQDI